jgi:hypothetical protein
MKQTAVEWLIKELINYDKLLDGKKKNDDATVFKANPTKIYDQANKMFEEQVKDAWDDGCYQSSDFPKTSDAEKYYNETYKSE